VAVGFFFTAPDAISQQAPVEGFRLQTRLRQVEGL
jgi:hypothetical protein